MKLFKYCRSNNISPLDSRNPARFHLVVLELLLTGIEFPLLNEVKFTIQHKYSMLENQTHEHGADAGQFRFILREVHTRFTEFI